MGRGTWIAVAVVTICAVLGVGWFAIRRHDQNTRLIPIPQSASMRQPDVVCDHVPDSNWHTVRVFQYAPVKTAYMVTWQLCPGAVEGRRVRVMDADFNAVLFQYEDDQIIRTEELDLLGDKVPQLLVVTGSAGTDDRIDWHIIGESGGKLDEWTWPNLDKASERLLRADEDFCCKEWNFHLQGKDILVVRGIYRKGDGNCCPSRGGVLVRINAIQRTLRLASVRRIGKPEYDQWTRQPFCANCALVSTR